MRIGSAAASSSGQDRRDPTQLVTEADAMAATHDAACPHCGARLPDGDVAGCCPQCQQPESRVAPATISPIAPPAADAARRQETPFAVSGPWVQCSSGLPFRQQP